MCVKGFVVALVLDVPHPETAVITHTEQVLATRVKTQASHPVVMTHLGVARFTSSYYNCFLFGKL